LPRRMRRCRECPQAVAGKDLGPNEHGRSFEWARRDSSAARYVVGEFVEERETDAVRNAVLPTT
jgi:hypothetical protein